MPLDCSGDTLPESQQVAAEAGGAHTVLEFQGPGVRAERAWWAERCLYWETEIRMVERKTIPFSELFGLAIQTFEGVTPKCPRAFSLPSSLPPFSFLFLFSVTALPVCPDETQTCTPPSSGSQVLATNVFYCILFFF